MKMLDLFSGIGGISLAAEWAGVETIAFCEIEPFCQKVLKKQWPDVPIFDDVKKLNRQALIDSGVLEDGETIDIVAGGFPCQPFSIAGRRRGTDDDRDLWPEMFRIIEEIRPTWVVGENVANFVNMELERTLINLESISYKTQTFIIPACGVDAKHQRDRTFVVAYSDGFGRNNWKYNRGTRQVQNDQERHVEKDDQERYGWFNRIGEICSVLSYTSSKRCNEMEQHDSGGKKSKGSICKTVQRSYEPRRCPSRWETEPSVGRVVDGIPNRVDRIRALGNAVVPQQIYPIFEAIVKISNT